MITKCFYELDIDMKGVSTAAVYTKFIFEDDGEDELRLARQLASKGVLQVRRSRLREDHQKRAQGVAAHARRGASDG